MNVKAVFRERRTLHRERHSPGESKMVGQLPQLSSEVALAFSMIEFRITSFCERASWMGYIRHNTSPAPRQSSIYFPPFLRRLFLAVWQGLNPSCDSRATFVLHIR